MKRLWRCLREEAGQSLVEFALALPILVFGLIGGADLARAFAIQLAVQNGARAGAEAAAITQAPTGDLAAAKAYDEISRTPYLRQANATINVDFLKADGTTPCALTTPTVAEPCWVTVRVRYTFQTIVPWPFIPNTANFDRSTTMRTIMPPTDSDTSCVRNPGSGICN
jgi:Flp pilus assembly protein TadG